MAFGQFPSKKNLLLFAHLSGCSFEVKVDHKNNSAKHFSVEKRGQFHQYSTCSFYIRKLLAQLFCAYVLGLYFTGVSLPAQKMWVER
jgi:hypothetical protein